LLDHVAESVSRDEPDVGVKLLRQGVLHLERVVEPLEPLLRQTAAPKHRLREHVVGASGKLLGDLVFEAARLELDERLRALVTDKRGGILPA
jgi:hypothetical protein